MSAVQLDCAWAMRDCEEENSRKWAAGLYNHAPKPALSVCPNPAWHPPWGMQAELGVLVGHMQVQSCCCEVCWFAAS